MARPLGVVEFSVRVQYPRSSLSLAAPCVAMAEQRIGDRRTVTRRKIL